MILSPAAEGGSRAPLSAAKSLHSPDSCRSLPGAAELLGLPWSMGAKCWPPSAAPARSVSLRSVWKSSLGGGAGRARGLRSQRPGEPKRPFSDPRRQCWALFKGSSALGLSRRHAGSPCCGQRLPASPRGVLTLLVPRRETGCALLRSLLGAGWAHLLLDSCKGFLAGGGCGRGDGRGGRAANQAAGVRAGRGVGCDRDAERP